ncbi:MAG: hypothetical protein RTU92_04440 [Candidatus Thorarchaeota archaeon]
MTEHTVRLIAKLECTVAVQQESMDLITRADRQGLLAKGNPKGIAAGIVYIACILSEDRMTLDLIGYAAGVSSSTVGKYYMTIARGLGYGER